MTLSLLTLTRDRTAHLGNLLLGVRRGGVVPDEIVVVVMGGEDPAPHVPDPGTTLRFVRLEAEGLPLGAARNRAAAEARSDRLVFLDVDCIPGRNLVRAYGRALARLDGLLMGGVAYLPPGIPDDDVAEETLAAGARRHPDRPEPPTSGSVRTGRYELFWSLSFAVRRDTFRERIGGFDERLAGYGGEDTDLAFTARAQGIPLAWVGDAWAYHQHHPTFDPPLNHVASIVPNARAFRAKWGVWPMEGWLRSFVELGIVRWDPSGTDLELLREPTDEELLAARRDTAVPPG